MRTITLAITNYNRVALLRESFAQVIDDDRISEIVISDDASDLTVYKAIQHEYKDIAKVKIHRNLSNVGVYQNKYRSALHATNDWVILFDSDNVLGKDYIDKLYELPEWDEHTEYCPAKAHPSFDYSKLGLITKENVNSMWRIKQFDAFVNTNNSFFNREEYLRHFDPDFEPISSDSIYMNYRWLAAGNKIQVVKGMEYYHRIHKGSHYVQNCEKSNVIHASIMEKIKQLR